MSINKLKVGKETELVDLSKYEGQESKIDRITTNFYKSKYHESGEVKAVLVETVPITTIKVEGKDKEVRGTVLLNLKKEGDDWVIPPNPESNFQKFLAYHKVKHPKELFDKSCKLTLRPKKVEGREIHFLGIKYK
jgi:hypothetical protein